ncbi:MarR family transcriptional regulator [Aurantimonas sp. Leaf443]|uniref:MarR family winged helix-turn-helix transcriptional regulator n=1 Tax=Aurantimonas sp. Leaf443 TaxID=1736378 RepID=UPI0006FADD04|nr:MarR family transcriptional regulator [Aurantimonas sp. Leaf443]KQT88448.1 MarR family transcriptional regulator [Aurantimonas sp. Leaf443]
MARQPTLPLDEQLCFGLYGASMAIGRLYKPMLDRLGITYPQYLVLHALWETQELTVGAIADRLLLDSSTITPLVKRLEAAGLVERTRSRSDERQVLVRATEEGRDLKDRSACLGEALLSASGLTLERVRDLTQEVRALRDALTAALRER